MEFVYKNFDDPHYGGNDGAATASAGDEGEGAGVGEVAATGTTAGGGKATRKAALSAIAMATDMVGWLVAVSSS